MGGGGGGGGGGGIFRGLRTNQSCQILVDLVSKVLFLIYRKKAKLTVKLWDSIIHFYISLKTAQLLQGTIGHDWREDWLQSGAPVTIFENFRGSHFFNLCNHIEARHFDVIMRGIYAVFVLVSGRNLTRSISNKSTTCVWTRTVTHTRSREHSFRQLNKQPGFSLRRE